MSKILDDIQRGKGTTEARNTILSAAPTSIDLTATQLALACTLGGAVFCAAGAYGPQTLLNWFKDDVRNRSDFGGDLSAARGQADCFAWTGLPSRNFTTKSPGTSGCKS